MSQDKQATKHDAKVRTAETKVRAAETKLPRGEAAVPYQSGFGNDFTPARRSPAPCRSAATRRSGRRTVSMPSRYRGTAFTAPRARKTAAPGPIASALGRAPALRAHRQRADPQRAVQRRRRARRRSCAGSPLPVPDAADRFRRRPRHHRRQRRRRRRRSAWPSMSTPPTAR